MIPACCTPKQLSGHWTDSISTSWIASVPIFNCSASADFAAAVTTLVWSSITVGVDCRTGCGVGLLCTKGGAHEVKKTATNKMAARPCAGFLNSFVLIIYILFTFHSFLEFIFSFLSIRAVGAVKIHENLARSGSINAIPIEIRKTVGSVKMESRLRRAVLDQHLSSINRFFRDTYHQSIADNNPVVAMLRCSRKW